MNNKIINENLIHQIYKKYQEVYNVLLPKITKIIFTSNNRYWAQFLTEDLYNKKYILYVDNDTMSKNKKFIKQILFHEFTHLCDSLQFLDKPLKEFKNIMYSYSEFHASKREMIERLKQIENDNITLHTEIVHVGKLTIESFIQQSVKNAIKDLNNMSQNNNINNFFFDTSSMYYLYGYLNALKSININYEIDIFKFPIIFLPQINELQNVLLKENVNVEEVILLHCKLEDRIEKQYFLNKNGI